MLLNIYRLGNTGSSSYIKFITINVFELYCCRIPSWVVIVYITYSMRCQVDLAILVIWNFVFPVSNPGKQLSFLYFLLEQTLTPHKAQCCLGQRGWPHRANRKASKQLWGLDVLKTFVHARHVLRIILVFFCGQCSAHLLGMMRTNDCSICRSLWKDKTIHIRYHFLIVMQSFLL